MAFGGCDGHHGPRDARALPESRPFYELMTLVVNR